MGSSLSWHYEPRLEPSANYAPEERIDDHEKPSSTVELKDAAENFDFSAPPTTPYGQPLSKPAAEEPIATPSGREKCVAWEIDVTNWKPQRRRKAKPKPTESGVLKEKNGPLEKSNRDHRQRKQLLTVTLPSIRVEPQMAIRPEEIQERKMLDLKRWYCMSRPQYQKSCGITSVVSCWNYLFSTLGNGSLRPITQEEALTVLGYKPPFGEINFGPFTGNITVMRWFKQLCQHYGVAGNAYFFYKLHGKRKTCGTSPGAALERLKEGLRSDTTAFIYHCYNHYFCPIGYELVAKKAENAYRIGLLPTECDTWILIGEPNRSKTGIHWKKWQDVYTDLNCQNPEYFNIRHTERGVQTRRTKRKGGNIHCIMAFRNVDSSGGAKALAKPSAEQLDTTSSEESYSSGNTDDNDEEV